MSDSITVRYLPDKNPETHHIPGIPLRDLTAAEFAALPPWLQESVRVCAFYAVEDPTPAPVTTTRRRPGPDEIKEDTSNG